MTTQTSQTATASTVAVTPLRAAYYAARDEAARLEAIWMDLPKGEDEVEEAAYDAAFAAAEVALEAYRDSKEPREWTLIEEGTSYDTFVGTEAEARAELWDGVDRANYSDAEGTIFVDVRCRCEDTGEEWSSSVACHAEEPDCADGHEHDWRSPHALVGGIESNPGVWGNGGGVKIHEVCRHCGTHRHTNTWATNPSNGTQGHESISYEDADDDSLAWTASERAEAIEVVVDTDRASGPYIEYADGLTEAELDEVHDAVPEGWTADWSSEVKLADGRHRAPLVRVEA